MAGNVERTVPWKPGDATRGLVTETQNWVEEAIKSGKMIWPEQVTKSAIYHAKVAIDVTDAAIYRMIMKESEQE